MLDEKSIVNIRGRVIDLTGFSDAVSLHHYCYE